MENEGLGTYSGEVGNPDLVLFKERLVKADGTLLPLHKRTADGKILSVAVRHLINPWEYSKVYPTPGYYDIERKIREGEDRTRTNPEFWGWREDISREGIPEMTGVLLIDIYVQHQRKAVPIGHKDWLLDDNCADSGRGGLHEAATPQAEHEYLAATRWNHDLAFRIDKDYQRQRLGSLMLAASGVVLESMGIRKFNFGPILDPAKGTYERFGFGLKSQYAYLKDVPIEQLSQHPLVNKTIADFVL